MNRLTLLRDCLLFLAIGLAFGCCGCLKAPAPKTVELSEVSGLLSQPAAETIPVPELDSEPMLTWKPATETIVEPDSVYTQQPLTAPEPSPIIPTPVDIPQPEPQQRTQRKFTGAVVYVKEDCQPCHFLDVDLRWLARFYDWTIAEEREATPADFILCRRPSPNGVNPYVEFYENGELIAKAEGYTTAPAFIDRKPSLVKLLKAHPVRQK
jgi:hypothetical protein